MNLAAWAERNGVARVTAYRWFRAGLLPVPARKVGRLILVDDLERSLRVVGLRFMRGSRRRIRNPTWIGRWRG